jgi:WD40 repeat protein
MVLTLAEFAHGQKVDKPARTDVYGDPLPGGAIARLGTARLRHGRGSTVAFAADGKTLISFGGDRTLRFWDVATGRQVRERAIPNGDSAQKAVLSPDGRVLAFQDFENQESLFLWDVEKNDWRRELAVGRDFQLHFIFTPDSETLITSHETGELKAWDVAGGETRLLGKQKREALSLSFSADGTLISHGWEPVIRFWDVKAGRQKAEIAVDEDLYGAAVSPDGRTIATWTWHNKEKDKGLRFVDAKTGKPVPGWTVPTQKGVGAAQFAPDGKTVFVSTGDGLLIWDPAAGKELRQFPRVGGACFAFSPHRKTAAVLGYGSSHSDPAGALIHVWDLATNTPHPAVSAERGHLHEVQSLAFSPDGKTLISACTSDHIVRLWDVATGRTVRSFVVSQEGGFRNLACGPDGKQLFLGSSPAIIRREMATGKESAEYRLPVDKGGSQHLLTMHLTVDGRTLLALSQLPGSREFWGLYAWDVASGKHLRNRRLEWNDFLVGYSKFSADGRYLARPGGSVWDTATGKEILHLAVDGHLLSMPVAISADGSLVAIGVHRELKGPKIFGMEMIALQIWELATMLPVARLETGKLAHLAFTSDGQRLIAAGTDALQLWDLATGKVIVRHAAPGRYWGSFGPSFASSMVLAPSGRTVATGQQDSTILLWDLTPPVDPAGRGELTAKEQEALWADLAGDDAGRALRAHARLVQSPDQTTQMLRDRLQPAKLPSPEELRDLLANLDDSAFSRREKATQRLMELGDLAAAALRKALDGEPTAEVRRRIERLLALPPVVRTPEARRHLRAVRILENVASPEGRQVLEKLSAGAPNARLTREAKAALQRLER